jgi:hypothetical protein
MEEPNLIEIDAWILCLKEMMFLLPSYIFGLAICRLRKTNFHRHPEGCQEEQNFFCKWISNIIPIPSTLYPVTSGGHLVFILLVIIFLSVRPKISLRLGLIYFSHVVLAMNVFISLLLRERSPQHSVLFFLPLAHLKCHLFLCLSVNLLLGLCLSLLRSLSRLQISVITSFSESSWVHSTLTKV